MYSDILGKCSISKQLSFQYHNIYEPARDKIYNNTCVTSKDSDQRIQPPSMAKVLIYPSLDGQRLEKAYAISKDSDQTAQMRRLI